MSDTSIQMRSRFLLGRVPTYPTGDFSLWYSVPCSDFIAMEHHRHRRTLTVEIRRRRCSQNPVALHRHLVEIQRHSYCIPCNFHTLCTTIQFVLDLQLVHWPS